MVHAVPPALPIPLPVPSHAPSHAPSRVPVPDIGTLMTLHGASVPGYRLGRRLGAGGFGVVFSARETRTGRAVAVKLLREEEGRERFRREIEILVSQRRNPHVVDVLAFHADAPVPYVVLELCEGGSLRAVARGPLRFGTTATILSHVAAGLAGLHEAGGFHRDVKPENLLVALQHGTGLRIVKVGDFGLARVPATGPSGMTRTRRGTPGYIAPEVWAGRPFTTAADVYALGVVAHELLTGSRDLAAPLPAALPPALGELVRGMVAAQASRRPSLDEVRRGVRAILASKQAA